TEMSTYRSVVNTGRVDGLILSSPLCQDPRIDYLMETELPFIVHGRVCDHQSQPETANFSYIDVDNSGAFYKATNLLIDMGHRHIALLNGDESMTFAYHRYQGYRQALDDAAISFEPTLAFSLPDMTEQQGFAATLRALSSQPQPTALLVSSIILALGATRAIRESGLEPGKDISLITYDDDLPYLEAARFNPSLTTVHSSIRQAGYEITHHLHEMIQSNGRHQIRKILDVDLIARGSTRAMHP
ncbi:MAG: substrate-binding domain-containing protein, partial [Thiolinea sp.]